jgi:membrane protease YdiL (CAAX protease family)
MKKSRISLLMSVAVLAVTGVALAYCAAGEDGLPHPLNGLLREIHGLGAFLGMIMFGYFFAEHVKKKLARYRRARAGRPWDGYLHLWLWLGLVATGLLLYYPQDVGLQSPISVASLHWYMGVILLGLFPVHIGRNVWSGKKPFKRKILASRD